MIRLVRPALVGLLLALSARAHASTNYPTVIRDSYGLKSTPPCTLCHASNAGGPNTVTTFFGRSLLAQGVQGMNTGALVAALRDMDSEQTDSDGDGVPDLDELRDGSDPNDGPGNDLPVPMTGCAVSRHAQPGAAWLLCGLGLVWARLRRSPKIGRRNPITGGHARPFRGRARTKRGVFVARSLQGAGR